MENKTFPFSALVGQDLMKTALLLMAVDPTLGGVLIRGQKGTGKSTAARALSRLLPPIQVVDGCPFNCPPDQPQRMHEACRQRHARGENLPLTEKATPFVELPLNATEDRVAGSLSIDEALRSGKRTFEPGLLAAANRGILYVDEVNLLDDHLVDLLLDAASSGINRVEREGISHSHPARFMLLGSMNPEEGELRPQFLDRFGLSVSVKGLKSLNDRQEVIRRHLAFEADPEAFLEEWASLETVTTDQVVRARAVLPDIQVPEICLARAVRLAMGAKAQGHRAEITIIKAARSLAALLDQEKVDDLLLKEAARLVLPHRMEQSPLAGAEAGQEQLDALLEESGVSEELEVRADDMQVPGAAAAGSLVISYLKKKEACSGSNRTA